MQGCNKENSKKNGFTLIELMLAVAFLGTLLLSVAMLAMRLIDMYTKGSTMRAVNSIGGAIVDDMRTSITSSSNWTNHIEDFVINSEGIDKAKEAERQYFRLHTNSETGFADYGAFCTNSYTYVFNYQAAMLRYREGATDGFIKIGTSTSQRPYGLARIKDPGCSQFNLFMMSKDEFESYQKSLSTGGTPDSYDDSKVMYGENDYFEVSNLDKEVTILLDGGKSDDSTDLQLYDFTIMSATQSNVTEQAIYDIAFVLGTTRGGININSTNNYCQKNSDAIKNEDYAEAYANNSVNYCSVNRFEFVARQTGGK